MSKCLINEESGSEQLVIPPKNFTELDRLATVVHSIEENCQLVPLGAVKLLPTHELIQNPAFRGLKIDEASKPENYLHFRVPHSKEKKLIIGRQWLKQIRIKPCTVWTSSTPSLRTQSRDPGHSKPTNPRLK